MADELKVHLIDHPLIQHKLTRMRMILAGLQIFVEYVVGIVRSDEAFDGQSHPVAEQGRADVSEVA